MKTKCSISTCPRVSHCRGWCIAHYGRWYRHGDPEVDVAWLHFVERVDASGDCWLWLGLQNAGGYGSYQVQGHRMAHRFLWTRLVGPIPEGMTLDHLCRVRLCVNPDHLEVVTMAENIRRGFAPPSLNARRTHCVHGHEFTVENTYWYNNYRSCRTCKVRLRSEHLARKSEASGEIR